MKMYRGCPEVEFVWNDTQSDPDLIYKEYTFNYYDVEDALWNDFLDETGHEDSESNDPMVEKEFNDYVRDRCVDYLEDMIYGGYFSNGSKTWHKQEHEFEGYKIKEGKTMRSYRRINENDFLSELIGSGVARVHVKEEENESYIREGYAEKLKNRDFRTYEEALSDAFGKLAKAGEHEFIERVAKDLLNFCSEKALKEFEEDNAVFAKADKVNESYRRRTYRR